MEILIIIFGLVIGAVLSYLGFLHELKNIKNFRIKDRKNVPTMCKNFRRCGNNDPVFYGDYCDECCSDKEYDKAFLLLCFPTFILILIAFISACK